MGIELKVRVLEEPHLEFADGSRHHEPKIGLTAAGPFSLRYGNDFPGSVKLGFVGTAELLGAGREWFRRCQQGILSGKENRRRHPDFPPFADVFRADLDLQDRWTREITQRELANVISKQTNLRFQHLVDLYDDVVRRLSDMELGPNVIICSLPDSFLEQFRTWSANGPQIARRRGARADRRIPKNQLPLPGAFEIEPEGSSHHPLARDFRRSLKARAMMHKVPIQLAHNSLFTDRDGGDDPATKAWDVCTACFYKAGGIPWRLADATPQVCFVGVSFHHLRTETKHSVYSSCAEAFSTETEGFVLRGDTIDWSNDLGRTPHLNEQQAFQLGNAILLEYRNRTGRNPIRLVLHKQSNFDEAERAGFAASWKGIPQREFIVLHPSKFALLPQGDYPPRRGTLADVNGSKYLYTTGFYEPWASYPGPHVPSPTEVRGQSEQDLNERSCREILGLTKMNFNSAAPFGSAPITTRMASEVGRIMAEVEEGRTPEMSYRYYM